MEGALSDLETLARDERLFDERAFSERVAALDQLDYICEVLRYSGRGRAAICSPLWRCAIGSRHSMQPTAHGCVSGCRVAPGRERPCVPS